jgi:hypothetical protein
MTKERELNKTQERVPIVRYGIVTMLLFRGFVVMGRLHGKKCVVFGFHVELGNG